MRNRIFLIFLLILFICFDSENCFSSELKPINLNFKGIEISNDTIAVTSDFGCLLLSYDFAVTWHQKRVFDRGTIVKFFFENNKMIVFQNFGKVSISTNGGEDWIQIVDLQDTILSIMKINEGYFVRLDEKLVLLSSNFQILKETMLRSDITFATRAESYINSLAFFKDKYIISMGGMYLNIYDQDLNLTQSINLGEYEFCSICSQVSMIYSDNKSLYVSGTYSIGKTSDLSKFEKIYETTEFVNKFRFFDGSIYYASLYNKIRFELHKINYPLENQIVANYNAKEILANITINDYILKNNKIFFVGDNKFIAISDLSNNSFNIISEFSGFSHHSLPDQVSDQTFLYYAGWYSPDKNYGIYQPQIYITENSGITIKSSINYSNNPKLSLWGYFYQKYYDSITNRIIFTGFDKYTYDFGGFLVTKDFGENFEFNEINGNYFGSIIIPNIQKTNDGFMTAINSIGMDKRYGTTILKVNNDFKKVYTYPDSNYVILHVHSINENSYLLLVRNTLTRLNEIKYTNDKFLSINYAKIYSQNDSLLYYNEYKFKDKDYLFMCFYDKRDTVLYFEAIDFSTNEITKIYNVKISDYISDGIKNTAFYSDGNIFYLSVRDTLFYIDNLEAMNYKKHLILPNNGRITRALKKYGDKFCMSYFDSINPVNLYWVEFPDKIEIKPQISAEDYNFGKFDIKETNYKSIKIKISNPSEESDLIISDYTSSNDESFIHNLPLIDTQNPLIIKPGELFEYTVTFKPVKVGLFKDSIIFKSNANEFDPLSIFEGEAIDTLVSSVKFDIETQNYLYSYPPYPLPATNEVSSLIYWDTSSDIDDDEMTVYNIYGIKVAGKEKLRIDKLTNYSGNLVWDCSNVPSGIYIIHIIHGTEKRAIKVIISK